MRDVDAKDELLLYPCTEDPEPDLARLEEARDAAIVVAFMSIVK